MALEAGLDTGPVYALRPTPIAPDATAGDVTDALVAIGTDLLVATLPRIGDARPRAADGRADLRRQAHGRGVRARPDAAGRPSSRASCAPGTPGPARGRPSAAARVKVWRAEVRDGVLVPLEVQPRGQGRACRADAWRRGRREPTARCGGRRHDGRRAPACSRSTRWCASRRARSRTSSSPRCCASTSLADRDRAFADRPRLRHGARRNVASTTSSRASSQRPVRRLDRPVRAALRLGAYQLLHGVARARRGGRDRRCGRRARPARAGSPTACSARAHAARAAVARADGRRGRALVPRLARGAAHRRPRCRRRHRARCTAMNEPAAVTLRPNPRRVTADALEAELRSLAIDTTRGALVPDALVVRGLGDPAQLAAVRDGRATPQDQASQAVATFVGAAAGERVADVAAAPGGKAGALAEQVGETGVVVALDVDAGRIAIRRGRGAAPRAPGPARRRRRRPHPAARDGALRPGAGRRALQRPRRAAAPGRRPVAARRRRRRRARRAAAGDPRRGGGSSCAPAARSSTRCARSPRAETVGIDEWATERSPASARSRRHPARPGGRTGRGALLLPQAAGTDGMYVLSLRRTDA